jgi:hypothetical protein
MADHQCTVCQDLVPTFCMIQCTLCGELACGDCVEPFKGDTACSKCAGERSALRETRYVATDSDSSDNPDSPVGMFDGPDSEQGR